MRNHGLFPALAASLALAACTTSSESAARDTMTADVGRFSPPPSGIQRARVGVPPFEIKGAGITDDVSGLAADQATTLLIKTQRFDVIERAQLDQLLKEQKLEGVVKSDEMAKRGAVRGVDYLLLGKVTNMRVKGEKTGKNLGLGVLPIPGAAGRAAGLFDYTNESSTITVECGVDLRLVDPTSGSAVAAEFAEYKRTDTIGATGIRIIGANADADATLRIDADNQGKILRLALDDCLKKMMPDVDGVLLARAKAPATDTSSPAK
jgi:curli biogenesis system outer membrane secretion channel CsgG